MSLFKDLLLLVLVAGALTACESSTTIGNPSTNLLKHVDVDRDAVSGIWEMQRGRALSEVTPNALLALPAVPHGDYELSVRFSRVVGQGSAHLILPVGDGRAMLVLGGGAPDESYSGLELIDGQPAYQNTTTDVAFQLVNHREYRLDITVRTRGHEARVDVDVDRKPFIRWRGDHASLSLPGEWDLGEATLAVGSDDTVIEVRTALLRMVPGEIEWAK